MRRCTAENDIHIPVGYSEAIVTPKASRSAEAIWSFRAVQSGESVVLPDGRCDLILRSTRANPDQFIPVVTGPATTAYTVRFDPGDQWYGLRLRPDRAIAVWGAQINRAKDHVARGDMAARIVPALGAANRRLDPIERLRRSVPQGKDGPRSVTLGRALDVVHAAGGRMQVAQLALTIGCSSRHLNRLFAANVGLSVKTYIQLAQFHRTLHLICSKGLSLSQAAFEGGYADHAHMTRAMRRFGGFTPRSIPKDLALPAVFHA